MYLRICLEVRPTSLPRDYHRPGWATFLRHSIAYLLHTATTRTRPFTHPEGCGPVWVKVALHVIRYWRDTTGTGISTRCPSTTPVGLALGPDSPWADWPAPGTLGLSAGKVLTCLIATHACILTPTPSTTGLLRGFTGCRTLPYPTNTFVAAASAVCLSPATLSAHNHLTSELLRTLSRVAASKPTSWLSLRLHILFHLAHA